MSCKSLYLGEDEEEAELFNIKLFQRIYQGFLLQYNAAA